MNRRRMMFFAYSSAFLLIIVFSILLYNFSGDTPSVILPTPLASSSSVSPLPGDYTGNDKKLDVSIEKIQNLIATMNRQDSYVGNITVTSYWSSGKTVYKILTYVSFGKYRLSVSSPANDTVKNIIIADEKIYIWYNGSKSYYIGNAGSDTAINDKFEMVPTYEDILKLSKAEILEAAYKQYNNEPCIFVRAQTGDLNYIYEYYVSVNSGLLIAAFTYDKTELIYSMTAVSVALTVPSDDMFKLPDGKSVLTS